MTRVILLAALLLAGCGHTPLAPPEPVIRTVTVEKPISVPCVPKDTPQQPAYPDTDAAIRAAPTEEDKLALVVAGRPLRMAWGDLAAGVINKCR